MTPIITGQTSWETIRDRKLRRVDLDRVREKYDDPDIPELALGGGKNREDKYAESFVYLFRRFGAPLAQSDEYKQLASYLLTTKYEDWVLEVNLSSYGFMSFYLWVPEAVALRVHKDQHRAVQQYHDKRRKWMKENYPLVCHPWTDSNTFLNRCWKAWLTKKYPNALKWVEISPEKLEQLQQTFLKESKERFERLIKGCPKKVATFPKTEERTGPTLRRAEKQFRMILEDLLSPTYIRDTYININGRVPDSEIRRAKTVGYSKSAGHGWKPIKDKENDT